MLLCIDLYTICKIKNLNLKIEIRRKIVNWLEASDYSVTFDFNIGLFRLES